MKSLGLVKTFSILRHACLVFATTLLIATSLQAATVPNQRLAFDHLTTGYPLLGQHEFVPCEACHVGGVFKGTPKQCNGCHNGVIARGKSPNHIPTTAQCDTCHNVVVTFVKSAIMNHSTNNANVPCATCHNGALAKGKNLLTHITTALDCGTCHTTITFIGARFAHTPEQVGTKKCFDCHNGVNAKGKTTTHIPSPNTCDTCHTTAGWKSASLKFNHSPEQIGTKTCFDCHNGTTATGKGPRHINSTNLCSACHQPNTGWVVKKVDHTQVLGTCSACHNGQTATGKSNTHIPYKPVTVQCDYCHSTTEWKPSRFNHSQVDTTKCFSCHNGDTTRGMGLNHIRIQPANDCSACHKPNTNWKVSLVDHTQTAGTCESCHNGTSAKTKSTNHIASTNDCLKCHKSTTSWTVPSSAVDHSQIQGSCVSCHVSGNTKSVKTFKSATHPNTTNNCTACHDVSPASWKAIKKPIDHKEVLGSCANVGCHTAPTLAMTKSTTHPATTSRCEACHSIPPVVWAAYKKPVDHKEILGSCVSCHVTGGLSQGKGSTHPTTSDNCLACHALPPAKWTPAIKVDHKEVTGSCISCHVSGNAKGVKTFKSPSHPSTTDRCDACHATAPAKWTPILKMNHAEITGTASCVSCHDGVKAKGRGTSHIATTTNCAACHTTAAWTPRTVDHKEIPSIVCNSCHNGMVAKGKSPTHIAYVPAALQCSECHSTTAWKPTMFDHTKVNTSNCYGCHNGTNARGKGPTHIATSNTCSACHKPTFNWLAFEVNHAEVTGSCVSCHVGANTKNVKTFKSVTHPNTTNNCVACHAKAPAKWSPALKVDHAEVLGSCANVGCHASSKLPTHMPTTNRCETCHVTTPLLWKPVPSNKVDHLQVTGACLGCHVRGNTFGVKTFKSINHIPSSALCDNCHDAPPAGLGWKVIIVDHTQVTGACVSCHTNPNSYGVLTYRSASHIPTTTDCAKCHSSGPPGRWTPALRVDHTQFAGQPLCSSCHNGINAKGKSPTHFVYTVLECNACHNTLAWATHTYPTHRSALFYSGHWFGDNACRTCHKQGRETITFTPYKFCAACHSGKFKPSDHKNNPINGIAPLNYEKCDGSCHQTKPQHNVSSRSF